MNIPILLSELDIKRFKTKFIKSSPHKCWEWKAGLSSNGYGKFSINHKCYGTHRIAYFLHYKIDPIDKFVCHHCDNKKCVNPHHLFLGTQLDNIRDCVKKGRNAFGDRNAGHLYPERLPHGDNHWTHKHPEKLLRGNKHPLCIHPEWAARGKNSGRYTHPETTARGEKSGTSKLTNKKIIEIRKKYSSHKFTYRQLTKIYKVSKSLIGAIVNRQIWKHI